MSSLTVPDPTIAVPTVLVDMNLPKVRELASRLRFDPTRGRIWLDDRRMALLDAVSFSSLREELIASLGMEVARGLLTRIGYASGCRDAKLAMRDAPDDVLRVGAFLHALQGFVLPEHIRRHGSAYEEDYQSEWIWKDSLEDEGHIASHGIGPHPACWTGVGYTSGYLTTCSGRAILVRELECRAQGHAQCRSVARPVSQWTGAEEDMRYLEPQPLPATRVFGGVQHARAAAPACEPTVAPPASDDEPKLVGGSAAFHVLRHKLLRVAPTRATVLLLGESGVGKRGGAGGAPPEPARAARFRGDQLRRTARGPGGVGAVRGRARRLLRRHDVAARTLRSGPGRDGELIDLSHLQSADSGFRPAEWLGLSRSGALVESHDAASEMLEGSTDVNEQIATRLLEDGPASLADLETALVRGAMNRAGGNISRAAPLLGLTRAQMEHRVKKVRRDEG